MDANTTFTCIQIWPFDDAPSPNCLPVLSSKDQVPLYAPGVAGAMKSTEISIVSLGATLLGRLTRSDAPNLSPEINTNLKDVVHEQVPMFLKRQVFVNFSVVPTTVPSGMVMSATNFAR